MNVARHGTMNESNSCIKAAVNKIGKRRRRSSKKNRFSLKIDPKTTIFSPRISVKNSPLLFPAPLREYHGIDPVNPDDKKFLPHRCQPPENVDCTLNLTKLLG